MYNTIDENKAIVQGKFKDQKQAFDMEFRVHK